MFSLNFPNKRSDQELSLNARSRSSGGMAKNIAQHQANFHNIFTPASAEQPMHHHYSLGLSLAIQDFIQNKETKTATEIKEPIAIEKLISSELAQGFTDIVGAIQEKAQIPKEGKYQPLSFDGELGDSIDQFTKKVNQELNIVDAKKEEYSAANDMKAQVDFFFDSLIDLQNSEVLVQEIHQYYTDNPKAARERKSFINDLCERYPLEKREMAHLVNLVHPHRYSLENMINVLKSMDKEYGLSNRKAELAGTAARFMAVAITGATSAFIRSTPLGLVAGNALKVLEANITHSAEMKQVDFLVDMKEKLNDRISDALILKEFDNVDEEKFAEIHSVLSSGRSASAGLMTSVIGGLMPQSMQIGTAMLGMGVVHPLLGASSLVALPLILRSAAKILPEFEDLQREGLIAKQKSTQGIKDIADTAENVLTSANPEIIKEGLETALNEEDKINIKLEKLNHGMQRSFMNIFWGVLTATAGVGYGLYEKGDLTEGEVFSSSFMASTITSPFLNMIGTTTGMLQQLQLVQQMEEVIQSGETISLENDAKKRVFSSLDNHDLEFKDLDFVGDNGEKIITDLNLTVPQGSFLTITGISGEGKSTLMKCLLGMNKPSHGSVNFGGLARDDLKQYGKDSLKASVSACGQSPKVLGHLTLRENLTLYSRNNPSDELIHETLNQLGLSDFKERLDETITKPSGGQRARIGIARALLKSNGDTRILVLDEPTSGLDIETRAGVIDTLQKLKAKRPELTIMCVTHNKEVKDSIGNNFDLSDYKRNQQTSTKPKTAESDS